MSRRNTGDEGVQINLKDIEEQLLNFEYSLKNELEIINDCVKLISPQVLMNIQYDILKIKERIKEEIESYIKFKESMNQNQGVFSQENMEEFNLYKLKYNKLMLLVEKIYLSSPEMEEVANNLTRNNLLDERTYSKTNPIQSGQSQRKQNDRETIKRSKNPVPNMMSKLPLSNNSFNSVNSSSISGIPPKSKVHAQEFIKGVIQRESNDENNKEFIKRELIKLKGSIQEVNKKIDIHDHSEFEMEIDRLRQENNYIIHDYKILKNDNTELMHSLRTLQKMAQEVKIQNERLLFCVQNPSMNRPTSPRRGLGDHSQEERGGHSQEERGGHSKEERGGHSKEERGGHSKEERGGNSKVSYEERGGNSKRSQEERGGNYKRSQEERGGNSKRSQEERRGHSKSQQERGAHSIIQQEERGDHSIIQQEERGGSSKRSYEERGVFQKQLSFQIKHTPDNQQRQQNDSQSDKESKKLQNFPVFNPPTPPNQVLRMQMRGQRDSMNSTSIQSPKDQQNRSSRFIIPSQSSNRNLPIDYEQLSSWARERVLEN